MGYLTPQFDEIQRVSVCPGGGASGYTYFLPRVGCAALGCVSLALVCFWVTLGSVQPESLSACCIAQHVFLLLGGPCARPTAPCAHPTGFDVLLRLFCCVAPAGGGSGEPDCDQGLHGGAHGEGWGRWFGVFWLGTAKLLCWELQKQGRLPQRPWVCCGLQTSARHNAHGVCCNPPRTRALCWLPQCRPVPTSPLARPQD